MQGRLVVGGVTVVVAPTVDGGAVGPGTGTVTVTTWPGWPGGPCGPGGPDGADAGGNVGAVAGPVVAVVAAEDGVIVGTVTVVGASPSRFGPYRSATTVPAMMLPASRMALPPRMTSRAPTPVYQRRATWRPARWTIVYVPWNAT
jgi:hypothetical protein